MERSGRRNRSLDLDKPVGFAEMFIPHKDFFCKLANSVLDFRFEGHPTGTTTFRAFCRETLVKLSYRKYVP